MVGLARGRSPGVGIRAGHCLGLDGVDQTQTPCRFLKPTVILDIAVRWVRQLDSCRLHLCGDVRQRLYPKPLCERQVLMINRPRRLSRNPAGSCSTGEQAMGCRTGSVAFALDQPAPAPGIVWAACPGAVTTRHRRNATNLRRNPDVAT